MFDCHGMRRETSRVSFLMCPFCVRALLSAFEQTAMADRGSFGPPLEGTQGSATRIGAHLRRDVPTYLKEGGRSRRQRF
jgi:hypothetical protein